MRGWLFEAYCPQCWAEISYVDEFALEHFSCIVCRIELRMVHECYDDGECTNTAVRVPPGERVGARN